MTNRLTSHSKSRRVRAFISWGVTLAWAGFMFNLSTGKYGSSFSYWLLNEILTFLHLQVSPETFSILHFFFRKLAHVTEYAVFSAFLYASLQNGGPLIWRPRTALWCVLIAGTYALTDEFHQLFVPGRTASLIDCGIDTMGASLGMLVVYGNERFWQVKNKRSETQNGGPDAA